jgi:hypothetical protein
VASHVVDAKLHHLIDEGHAGSPAFKDWIGPDARAALFDYVKGL